MMDALAILSLVFLEGILSLDNALVLAVAVKHLPADQQKKALHYGMWGAFIFRALALLFLTSLLKLVWVKFIGAAYLIWMSMKYFIGQAQDDEEKVFQSRSFWQTILLVEMLDIAFSVDSIFAAVGVSSKYEIILIGGILGIIMMRFASYLFVELLKKYTWLEHVAYILVFGIGVKLALEGIHHYGA